MIDAREVVDWRDALRRGDFEAAERQRSLAVTTGTEPDDPAEAAAVKALADVQGLLREKAWTRATRRLEELSARPPLVDWGFVEARLARLREAGAALERHDVDAALVGLGDETAPEGPLAAAHATLLGTAFVLDGRGAEAAGLFERALELDPKHPRALVNLGNVALEEGRTDEAIELYERALKIDEDFPNAHHNLGVAYRRKGQVGKSVQALRRAQRADRSRQSAEARESLSGLGQRLRRGRLARWAVWAAVAAFVVWLLLTRG